MLVKVSNLLESVKFISMDNSFLLLPSACLDLLGLHITTHSSSHSSFITVHHCENLPEVNLERHLRWSKGQEAAQDGMGSHRAEE